MSKEKNQIVVITAVVFSDDKMLFQRRSEPSNPDAHLKWELPGGVLEFGEIPEQSIIREVQEETGCIIEPVTLLPHIQTNMWEYEKADQHTIVMCYMCKYIKKKNTISNDDEVDIFGWYSYNDINFSNSLPGTKTFVNLALSVRDKNMHLSND